MSDVVISIGGDGSELVSA